MTIQNNMVEVSNIIKAFIEKSDFKTFLFSIGIAITVHKLWISDWLWTAVIWIGCYLISCLIIWIYKRFNEKHYITQLKKEENQQKIRERDLLYRRLDNTYNSFPFRIKHALIELYNLPQQNFSNVRILADIKNQGHILSVCCELQYNIGYISVEESYGSSIITIDDVLCEVLEKHTNDYNY